MWAAKSSAEKGKEKAGFLRTWRAWIPMSHEPKDSLLGCKAVPAETLPLAFERILTQLNSDE